MAELTRTLAHLSKIAYRSKVSRYLFFLVGLVALSSAKAQTPPLPPKVGIIVVGDPDELSVNTASQLSLELVGANLRTPSDPALVSALLGIPTAHEDGLEKLRAMRRGLVLSPQNDALTYQRIGRIASADALVVVRHEGLLIAEVFDIGAAQFYQGTLNLETSTPEEQISFIKSRALEAQTHSRHQAQGSTAPSTQAASTTTTQTGKARETSNKEVARQLEQKPAKKSKAKKRLKKAWPWLVAAALAAAGTTYLIIDRGNRNTEQGPVFRFRPEPTPN